MKRILLFLVVVAMALVMAVPSFAAGGGSDHPCVTKKNDGTRTCSGGSGHHTSTGNTGGGRHLTYDPDTGVSIISGGSGFGGGGEGGGGGGRCISDFDSRECTAGGSYF